MNYLISNFDDNESGYVVQFRSHEAPSESKAKRPTMGRRRGKAPQQFNGIHRRRNKKIRW